MGRGANNNTVVERTDARALTKPRKMYHVAPTSARELIVKEGLQPANALTRNQLWRRDPAFKRGDKGVFLFSEKQLALGWVEYMDVLQRSDYRKGRSKQQQISYDIYEAIIRGELQTDDMMQAGSSFISPAIPPTRLQRV